MGSTRPREIDLPKLCRRRQREKLRNLKDSLELDELEIYEWEDSATVDYEPFPEGAFERLKSNNIWEKVSEYLTHPTDITNAGLACPKVFAERRMLASLRETFQIMKCQKRIYSKTQSGEDEEGNPKINCLAVRGVSKAWKKIFDEEIFEHDFASSSWYTLNWDIEDSDPIACQFPNEESVDTALASLPMPMCGRQKSNFPMTRKLCVDTTEITEDEDAFHAKLITFLEQFGESVWLLEYRSRFHPLDGTYAKICEIVKLTPNLRALALKGFDRELSDEDSDEILDENIRLEERVGKSPFPTLKSMEYFQFDRMDNALILGEIFRKCGNLKSVTSYTPHFITDEMAEALGNLKLERYSQVHEHLIVSLAGEFRNWPLRKITMWIDDEEFARTSFLWPFLNEFRSTLQFLDIYASVEKDDPNLQLDLPHLKFLILASFSPPTTIGFDDLLPLKSLERMLVAYEDFNTSHENRDEMPQGHIYVARGKEEKTLCSNIWNCFQELQEFCIDVGDRKIEIYDRPSNSKPEGQSPLSFRVRALSRWKAFKKWIWNSISSR